jgi:thiamine-phosphate diphosphorylase
VTGSRRAPPLHVVTDDEVLATPAFAGRAAEVIRNVGDRLALHLRGPRSSGRALFEIASALAPAAAEAGALLLVNDRVDVALASGASGVHLGLRGMTVADTRRLVGAERVVGRSVHSAREAEEAAGADFLLVGTIFATPSHPGRPGAGTALLGELGRLGVPLIAIGGITADRVPDVRAAGAAGIAVQRAVWAADDAAAAAEELLHAWQETR